MTKIEFRQAPQVLVSMNVRRIGCNNGLTSMSEPTSKTPFASAARCQIGFDPFFEMSLKMEEDDKPDCKRAKLIFSGNVLTESDRKIEYGPDEVPESERSVLPDVLGHDGTHHRRVQLKAHVQQGLSQPLGLQYARLLLGVGLERALPELDGADEVLELFEVDLAEALRVEGGYDEAAHFHTGAALDVI